MLHFILFNNIYSVYIYVYSGVIYRYINANLKKIENPKHWCQQHYISDSNNIPLTKGVPVLFELVGIMQARTQS